MGTMAGVQIGLILSFLFFHFLTRTVWVRIIQEKDFALELHLPLLAIRLSDLNSNKPNKIKLGTATYIKIILSAIKRFRNSSLVIEKIALPCDTSSFGISTLIRTYGYQGLIYTLIAYLNLRNINTHIKDNAIISSPDVNKTQFHLTVKLALFQLAYALLIISRDINKEKKARAKKYVGE